MKLININFLVFVILLSGFAIIKTEEAATQDEIDEIKSRVDSVEKNVDILLGDVRQLKKLTF